MKYIILLLLIPLLASCNIVSSDSTSDTFIGDKTAYKEKYSVYKRVLTAGDKKDYQGLFYWVIEVDTIPSSALIGVSITQGEQPDKNLILDEHFRVDGNEIRIPETWALVGDTCKVVIVKQNNKEQ